MRRTNDKNNLHKSLLVKLSLATILSVFSGKADAQGLICGEPLVFGEILTCGAPGSVTIRPDTSTTSSCVTIGGAPASRAKCIVTQSFPFRPIQINVTTPTVTLNNTATAGTMGVNSFNVLTNAGGTQATVTGPHSEVPIGATLNVGATQATGRYEGTFGVTAVLQ